jgi:hypothetical protein
MAAFRKELAAAVIRNRWRGEAYGCRLEIERIVVHCLEWRVRVSKSCIGKPAYRLPCRTAGTSRELQ